MADFDYHERALAALSKAKNNLESFIYDIRDKLEHDSLYRVSITPEERTKIDGKLTEIDAWLWDDGLNADVKVRLIIYRSMTNLLLFLSSFFETESFRRYKANLTS